MPPSSPYANTGGGYPYVDEMNMMMNVGGPDVDADFIDDADGALDLDEEEMQLLWRKLSRHAKRMRERDAAAHGNSNNLKMAHSFSSPVERPERVAPPLAGAAPAVTTAVASDSAAAAGVEDKDKKPAADAAPDAIRGGDNEDDAEKKE